ncbi:helix-turn-helix transcriptional regulator [Kitasatospora cineracea]|uniref:helix-turn-helix transcriptional regulator n=1 Tax=Kitasatospora cineracea TaxID=88074 RepID=UPI00343722BD
MGDLPAGLEPDPDPDGFSLSALVGLDETCVRVYRAVIGQPGWGVAETARELGIDESRVRRALDRLTELSMLYLTGDDSNVAPLHPEVGLAAYLHRREVEIHAQQAQLSAARAATAELAAVYLAQQSHRGHIGLEALEGVGRVRARLAELADHATQEVLTFMPGGAQSRAALDASRPLDEKSIANGVRLRTVYLDSVRNDRATTEYARWLGQSGGEIRTIPTLPIRMLIADRSVALLPIDPENTREGAIVVHAPSVITALVAMFEAIWEKATPMSTPKLTTVEGPTPQELELLKLLESGSTDDVASRKLGLSLRTTRRMVAELMNRLGARSRFEAGLLASRAGWL